MNASDLVDSNPQKGPDITESKASSVNDVKGDAGMYFRMLSFAMGFAV